AKYLFIAAQAADTPSTHETRLFFKYILERIDFERDMHFQTCTTIDTLDYSGYALNEGSKVIIAAAGDKKRTLCKNVNPNLKQNINSVTWVSDGILAIEMEDFISYENASSEIEKLVLNLEPIDTSDIGIIVICNDSEFLAKDWNNFLWATFTRSDPSKDIYGIGSQYINKHWGCKGPIIIDARTKPHHAPILQENEKALEAIEHFFQKGQPLEGF
ncbi:MAG: 3-octaprenyl-4-hydroxybenzoate carboxy-lyase, partial [Pseudopedobacter saltans]